MESSAKFGNAEPTIPIGKRVWQTKCGGAHGSSHGWSFLRESWNVRVKHLESFLSSSLKTLNKFRNFLNDRIADSGSDAIVNLVNLYHTSQL